MALATTVALAVLRGPVRWRRRSPRSTCSPAGRLIAGVGPGSSERDYDVVGIPFEERWKRFDEAVAVLRALLGGEPLPDDLSSTRCPRASSSRPAPGAGIPLWIGSWGSQAGLRRVARAGDGWLASAYNTTPGALRRRPRRAELRPDGVPERAGDDVDLGRRDRAEAIACSPRYSRRS